MQSSVDHVLAVHFMNVHRLVIVLLHVTYCVSSMVQWIAMPTWTTTMNRWFTKNILCIPMNNLLVSHLLSLCHTHTFSFLIVFHCIFLIDRATKRFSHSNHDENCFENKIDQQIIHSFVRAFLLLRLFFFFFFSCLYLIIIIIIIISSSSFTLPSDTLISCVQRQ